MPNLFTNRFLKDSNMGPHYDFSVLCSIFCSIYKHGKIVYYQILFMFEMDKVLSKKITKPSSNSIFLF